MYRQKKVEKQQQPPKTPKRTMTGKEDQSQARRKPKHDALLIQLKDCTYAELLKKVKKNVNPSELGVDIKNITKTKSGELLLTVQNGSDKAEVLKKEILEKIPEASTSVLIPKKILHVKGLDEVVTEEEIRDAVCKATQAKRETFEIRALRPAYGNRQNVTLIMPVADADKLIECGKIKIGWTMCNVQERQKEQKCFKCWEYGHVKNDCNGPDREKNCLKCNQEGHRAKDCKNRAYCVHCKEYGHQSDNPKCTQKRYRRGSEVSTISTI